MANQYQGFTNPTIIPDHPMGWEAANQQTGDAISKISNYAISQQQNIQQLQLQQASDLSKFKTLDQVYYGGQHSPQLDAMLSQNPYGRHLVGQPLSQAGQSQPITGGNPNVGGSMIGAPGTNMFGSGVLPTPATTSSGTGGDVSGGTGVSMNPVSTGGTMTSGGMEPPKFSQSIVNPVGEQIKAQAQAQGSANVAPSKEFATKMASTQAQASENIARDNSQMTSVFATLKNLHDIHSKLASSNLAGTHLGEVGMGAMPYAGDVAAILGQKPADLQNKIISPENQNLMGQFQSGRNEGITRAIQPIQNQVDKTGSSRISDSLMHMTEGEYGQLTDSQAVFDGKTLGTAKTLYRITLASQNYADQLKAQGIKLNSNDPNFNPDTIAQHIYQQAQGIQFTPAQAKDFNGYANQIMGTKGTDYSGVLPKPVVQGGSVNPVMNQNQSKIQSQPTKQGQQSSIASQFTRQELLDEINRRKNLRDVESNISQ
jgi:hypothetical protein